MYVQHLQEAAKHAKLKNFNFHAKEHSQNNTNKKTTKILA